MVDGCESPNLDVIDHGNMIIPNVVAQLFLKSAYNFAILW